MRKLLLVILILIAAGAIWRASVSSTGRTPHGDKNTPLLVVSGYVPYTLTKQLAGNRANVSMLLPPGAEPHAFEPTPGVLVSLKHAAAFIYTSEELEPWAKDLAKAAGQDTHILALADALPKTKDPHVWMNFAQTDAMARRLADLLAQLMPQHRAEIDENYAKFSKELTGLDRQYKTALAHCASREVVHIGHLAFEHLTDAYGLKLTALSGTSHNGEHSAKKLAKLIKQIRAENIRAIFTEDTLSPRLASAVAQETGTQILPLYPIEHISKDDFNRNVTYTELMRRNLDSLVRGLLCKA